LLPNSFFAFEIAFAPAAIIFKEIAARIIL
jgi:hypothetical protein